MLALASGYWVAWLSGQLTGCGRPFFYLCLGRQINRALNSVDTCNLGNSRFWQEDNHWSPAITGWGNVPLDVEFLWGKQCGWLNRGHLFKDGNQEGCWLRQLQRLAVAFKKFWVKFGEVGLQTRANHLMFLKWKWNSPATSSFSHTPRYTPHAYRYKWLPNGFMTFPGHQGYPSSHKPFPRKENMELKDSQLAAVCPMANH